MVDISLSLQPAGTCKLSSDIWHTDKTKRSTHQARTGSFLLGRGDKCRRPNPRWIPLLASSLFLWSLFLSPPLNPILFLTSSPPYCLHLSHTYALCTHRHSFEKFWLSPPPAPIFLSCFPHLTSTSTCPTTLCVGEWLRTTACDWTFLVKWRAFAPPLPQFSPSGIGSCPEANAGLCLIPHHDALWWLRQRSVWSQRRSLHATSQDAGPFPHQIASFSSCILLCFFSLSLSLFVISDTL